MKLPLSLPQHSVSALCLSLLFAFSVNAQDSTPAKQAEEAGFRTCLAKIKETSNFVFGANKHASHDYWSKINPDERVFSSFGVKTYSDGSSHIVIFGGQDKTGKCFAEYRETMFWPKACGVVREETWSKFKFVRSLNDNTIQLENELKNVSVYLTPEGNGNSCITTRRELNLY